MYNSKTTVSLVAFALSIASYQALALPRNANGTVVSGSATIFDTDANTTTINQTSDIAEINWSDFDLAVGQVVEFNVPRAESLSINRVTSGIASEIAGRIASNGQIYLINEHGINFHNGAHFSAPTFMVSTIDSFNTQADVNQYAKITADSLTAVSGNTVGDLIFIAPFIGFYTTTAYANTTLYFNKKTIAANRVNVQVTGADNTITVDVPDAQPDVVVPGGEKLGIEIVTSPGNGIFYMGDTTQMIAKAVSVAQNIDSIINLDATSGADISLRTFQHPARINDPIEYDFDLYSSGHILLEGNIGFSNLLGKWTPIDPEDALVMNLKLVADKNLFFDHYGGGINKVYFEAGHNLILNAGNTLFNHSYGEGAYGERIIKLGTGTLAVESGDYDFNTLAGIETYTAGTIGYVEDFWVGKQDYVKPADTATFSYYGPDANIAIKTTLEAPNIDINTAIDLTGSVSERAWKSNFSYDRDYGGATGIVNHAYFIDPGVGNGEDGSLTLSATDDVNVNANITMDGMGDLNVIATNYNVNGPAVVNTGASAENFTVYTPPPPPAPPAPDVPEVTPEPTFEELINNVSNLVVDLVKDKFYEAFDSGSQSAVEQQINKPALVKNISPTTEATSSPKSVEGVQAASCAGGVCAVLDKEDRLETIDEAYLEKRARLKLKSLADRVVNLRGMIDQIRF